MGYYSTFEIIAEPPVTDLDRFREDFAQTTGYNIGYDLTLYEVKWYSFLDHMTRLSKQYPDHLFTVNRTTEEATVERYYFIRGHVQNANARIVYDEFDWSAAPDPAPSVARADVLVPRALVGDRDKMWAHAVALGYDYFLWNDRVYSSTKNSYKGTMLTVDDLK